MRLSLVVSVGAVLLSACGQEPPAPEPVVVPPVTPAPPVAPRKVRVSVSYAVFRDDALSECVDFEVFATPPDVVPVDWPPTLPDPTISEPPAGMNRIPRMCSAHLSDRTAFARCTLAHDATRADGAVFGNVTTRTFYGLEVFEDDARMSRCMEQGGEWWRMNPTDPAVLDAQAAAALRDAQEQVRRLEGRR